jgi:hypothetical protein
MAFNSKSYKAVHEKPKENMIAVLGFRGSSWNQSMFASVKLFMALVWLVLGGCIFYWEWTHPDRPGLTIWNTGISIGWGAIVLSVYNLLRWWMAWSYQKRQRAIAEAEAQRLDELRRRSRPSPELNPDFDFSDSGSPEEPKSP